MLFVKTNTLIFYRLLQPTLTNFLHDSKEALEQYLEICCTLKYIHLFYMGPFFKLLSVLLAPIVKLTGNFTMLKGKQSLDQISLDRNCHFSLDRKF